MVGIDSLNIDAIDGDDGAGRPVHTTLLGAGIPIVEHLTDLHHLPSDGFTFTAVPPKIAGLGTFTVRAHAHLRRRQVEVRGVPHAAHAVQHALGVERAAVTQRDGGDVARDPDVGDERVGGDLHAEVLVLGSGPGGYTAAFRAADLGRQVVMVERQVIGSAPA